MGSRSGWWSWSSEGILRVGTSLDGLLEGERAGDAARGDAGADEEVLEVGRMLAERGFASSLRRHLHESELEYFSVVACLRFGAIKNGGAGMHDLLLAHGAVLN